MGVYSTHDPLTKDEVIEIIKDRISRIEDMSDRRIIDILEACTQGIDSYGSQPLDPKEWEDEYAYFNWCYEFKKD